MNQMKNTRIWSVLPQTLLFISHHLEYLTGGWIILRSEGSMGKPGKCKILGSDSKLLKSLFKMCIMWELSWWVWWDLIIRKGAFFWVGVLFVGGTCNVNHHYWKVLWLVWSCVIPWMWSDDWSKEARAQRTELCNLKS